MSPPNIQSNVLAVWGSPCFHIFTGPAVVDEVSLGTGYAPGVRMTFSDCLNETHVWTTPSLSTDSEFDEPNGRDFNWH